MLSLTYSLLWILAIFQGLAILVLIHKLADLKRLAEYGKFAALNRIPAGRTAPQFSAFDVRSGIEVESASFVGARALLLMLSSECGTCRRIIGDLARSEDSLEGLIVCWTGSRHACQAAASNLSSCVPVLQRDDTAFESMFGVSSYPTAILINERWAISSYRYPSNSKNVFDYLSELSSAVRTSPLEALS